MFRTANGLGSKLPHVPGIIYNRACCQDPQPKRTSSKPRIQYQCINCHNSQTTFIRKGDWRYGGTENWGSEMHVIKWNSNSTKESEEIHYHDIQKSLHHFLHRP